MDVFLGRSVCCIRTTGHRYATLIVNKSYHRYINCGVRMTKTLVNSHPATLTVQHSDRQHCWQYVYIVRVEFGLFTVTDFWPHYCPAQCVLVPIPTPYPHGRNLFLSTLAFQTPYTQRQVTHSSSVHLAAGHVIKSFTTFSGAQVSSSRVWAILQSCQWLSGVSCSRVSGLCL